MFSVLFPGRLRLRMHAADGCKPHSANRYHTATSGISALCISDFCLVFIHHADNCLELLVRNLVAVLIMLAHYCWRTAHILLSRQSVQIIIDIQCIVFACWWPWTCVCGHKLDVNTLDFDRLATVINHDRKHTHTDNNRKTCKTIRSKCSAKFGTLIHRPEILQTKCSAHIMRTTIEQPNSHCMVLASVCAGNVEHYNSSSP